MFCELNMMIAMLNLCYVLSAILLPVEAPVKLTYIYMPDRLLVVMRTEYLSML